MPTDQPGQLIAEEAPTKASPIENELPTYRAISNRAVFSVICGVLASFSFADLTFLVFSALAVILGILANRAIKRSPDVLTGVRLANVGIAMGLIFGLTVVTYTSIQYFLVKREATRFAMQYAQLLKEGTLGDVLLYREMPDRRKDQTAADKQKQYDEMKARDRMMFDQRMGPNISLHRLLKDRGGRIEFVDIEQQGIDDSLVGAIYHFAAALYEVEPPPSSSPSGSHEHQYALAIFKGKPMGRHYEWWIEDVRFPYSLKSYQGEVKKAADDGHGHAGGGH